MDVPLQKVKGVPSEGVHEKLIEAVKDVLLQAEIVNDVPMSLQEITDRASLINKIPCFAPSGASLLLCSSQLREWGSRVDLLSVVFGLSQLQGSKIRTVQFFLGSATCITFPQAVCLFKEARVSAVMQHGCFSPVQILGGTGIYMLLGAMSGVPADRIQPQARGATILVL